MIEKKQHGLTGNQNAAKSEAAKVSDERLTISVPKGTILRIKKAAAGGKSAPWIREAIEEKLSR